MDATSLFILVTICLAVGFFSSSLLRALGSGEKANASHTDGLRLHRSPDDGQMVVELDGQVVASAHDLTDAQRADVQNSFYFLNAWLGQSAHDLPSAPPTVEETLPDPLGRDDQVPETELPPRQVSPAPPPAAGKVSPPTASAAPDEPAKPVKFSLNPLDILVRAMDAERPKLAQASKSIVAQVNDILQEKIKGTPLAQRGIELTEKADHTMLIVVGLNRYDGIDAVADEEIKALIRQCVSEWSSRTS